MNAYLSTHLHDFLLGAFRISLWLIIVGAVFIPLERLFAIRRQKIWRKEFGTDLCYYVTNMVVPGLIMGPVVMVVAHLSRKVIPHGFYVAVGDLPFWLRGLIAFVVGDLGYYWAHRCLHTVPFLWRFHAIHHSVEEVDFLVNTRLHPIDMAFGRLGGIIPLYVLGLTGPVGPADSVIPALVILTGSLWGYFLHANLRWRYGPIDWVLATPVFHRWHHTVTPANRNYASMLPWIDRIFGTFHVPPKTWPEAYGIDSPMPEGFADQLAYPFVRRAPARATT